MCLKNMHDLFFFLMFCSFSNWAILLSKQHYDFMLEICHTIFIILKKCICTYVVSYIYELENTIFIKAQLLVTLVKNHLKFCKQIGQISKIAQLIFYIVPQISNSYSTLVYKISQKCTHVTPYFKIELQYILFLSYYSFLLLCFVVDFLRK